MIVWIWTAVLVTALVLYLYQTYTRFSRYGVKNFTPVPFLGEMTKMLLQKEHMIDFLGKSYDAFPDDRFVGKYQFLSSVVVLKDLELIKKIFIKDFEHFVDHRVLVDENNEPLFGRNLFCMRGQTWKDMRSTLSPAFTSSKIRLMVPLMLEVGEQMVKILNTRIQESGVGYIDVEGKDLASRFTNDIIASCAFGLKVDSLDDENNEFFEMGKQLSTFGFKQMLILILHASFPPALLKNFKLTLFPEKTRNFFRNIIQSTMEDREIRQIFRPDMIHLLMEAKKGRLVHETKATEDADAGFATVQEFTVGKKQTDRVWTDDDLIAQAVLFFAAGFETVSSTLSFLLHELACNPEIQDKLYQEIKENDTKNGGKFDFTSVQKMQYLDMVVSEVLRLWPPAIGLDRLCTKDYNMGRPNSEATQDFIMRKGEGLAVPVWSIHRDPQYFPNPDKFDPERFSEENKHNIKPITYIPFGLGPRNCIGSRFALCEVKVLAYTLLKYMEVSMSPKIRMPVEIEKNSFNLRIKGGQWIRLKIRKQ